MNGHQSTICIGDTRQEKAANQVTGQYVNLLGEQYYQIRHYDAMEPFFMSIVSSSDHWLFIASTGGISAGRISAEQSLFPYYTVDKITENYENTGSKTILLVNRAQRISLWEPFSERNRDSYHLDCSIYKNIGSTAVVFEEHNLDLGIICRYAWRVSDKFGFVKTTWLTNTGDTDCQVELLDGIQNILPANVVMVTQNTFSTLLDAYKRSELDVETGLAIFTLSSTLTDLAEPSESLLATTVAQLGFENPDILLSSVQLDTFRRGIVYLDYDRTDRADEYVSYNDYEKDEFGIRFIYTGIARTRIKLKFASWTRDYPNAFAFDEAGQPQKSYDGIDALLKGEYRLTKEWRVWAEYLYEKQNSTDLRYDYDLYQVMAGVIWRR